MFSLNASHCGCGIMTIHPRDGILLPSARKITSIFFGEIVVGDVGANLRVHPQETNPYVRPNIALNEIGLMIKSIWEQIPGHYPGIEIDEFVIMPNHMHGIIVIVGAPLVGARREQRTGTRPAPTLGNIIGAFKSITTNEYSLGVKKHNWQPFVGKFWQRNYYEHIIRNDTELNKIREYIQNNSLNWSNDSENTQ